MLSCAKLAARIEPDYLAVTGGWWFQEEKEEGLDRDGAEGQQAKSGTADKAGAEASL